MAAEASNRQNINLLREPIIDTLQENEKFTRPLLILILFFGLLLRIGYLYELSPTPLPVLMTKTDTFDQYHFMQLAKEFLDGNWLGSTVTRYSPAYSYLIAVIMVIFSKGMLPVFIFQMLFGLLGVFILYKTASLLFDNNRIGLIAAFLGAFYGPLIFYEGMLLRASVIAYLNLVGFYFILIAVKEDKPPFYFFSSLIIGLSMVLRPNILPVFIILYIFLAVKKPFKTKTGYVLTFLLGLTLVISPLSIRNRILQEKTLISYQGPSTFWIGNTYDVPGVGLKRSPLRNRFAKEAGGSITKTLQILVREIKQHPEEYKGLYWRKIKMYFNGYEIPANTSFYTFREYSYFLKMAFFNFTIICPLALFGIFFCWRRYPSIGLLYLFIVVLSFSVIVFHIQGRYRIPSVPFFIIFASHTIYWLKCIIVKRRPLAICSSAVILFLLFKLSLPDIGLVERVWGKSHLYKNHANLGSFFSLLYFSKKTYSDQKPDSNDLIMARMYLTKALTLMPDSDRKFKTKKLIMLGLIQLELDEKEKALEAFRQALRINPDNQEEIKQEINKRINHVIGEDIRLE